MKMLQVTFFITLNSSASRSSFVTKDAEKPQGQSFLMKHNHEMKMGEKKMNIKGVAIYS